MRTFRENKEAPRGRLYGKDCSIQSFCISFIQGSQSRRLGEAWNQNPRTDMYMVWHHCRPVKYLIHFKDLNRKGHKGSQRYFVLY